MTAPHNYTLEIHYVDRPAEVRQIEAGRIVLGRDGGDIILRDSQASAAHAEIEFENGQLVVRDLGSSNGTWLGERKLPQFALSPGQVFRCGNSQIRLLAVVGGQPLTAGRTVMSEGYVPPSAPTPAPAPPRPGGASPGASPHHAQPIPSAGAKANTGAIVGAVLGTVVLLGAVGAGAWFLFAAKSAEDPELARDETPPLEQPEPEPEPTPLEPTPEPLEPDPNEVLAPEDPDLGAIYRSVGGATVVIRVPGSVGSGVVIDDSGIILTNHHVIEGGTHDGLSMGAKVVFGQYSDELRTFEPRHEQLPATVMKIDIEHDLALIKLDTPLPDLNAVPVASENPYPGQRVAAIGHAGVGMLWAIKGGEISAAGSLAGHTDLLLDADEGDRDYLERQKQRFEKMGRVIQSTAKILPGDSGGPLVNLAGEIVGINAFGRIDAGTNQWLSFHIHLAEVRDFVAQMPTRPLAMVPDPWIDTGSWSRVSDTNLDGRADVLLLDGGMSEGGYSNWGALLDLDGDSFEGSGAPDEVNATIDALVEGKDFDAEFAVLHEPSGAHHYWYDRDGVDGYDLYILDEHGLGKPSGAWSLDALGGAEPIEGLELDDGLSAALFSDPKLAASFASIGAVVFPGQVEAGSQTDALPPPTHQLENAEVSFFDGNGDGLHDQVTERATFTSRSFFDLDQNSIGRTTTRESLAVLLEVASVDSELALIEQGGSAWVWYDCDNDGRFELVLRSHDFDRGIADEAFTLASPDAPPVAAPEHVGRLLLRPALFETPTIAARLAQHEAAQWTSSPDDDGLASFPALAHSALASILIDGHVAIVSDDGRDITLFDVDGNSSAGATRDVAALVRSGEYDAEFALLSSNGIEWAFYDRDNDGRFDWVLVSTEVEQDTVTQAYALTGSQSSLQPASTGSPMINATHFGDPGVRAQFEALAQKQLPDRVSN